MLNLALIAAVLLGSDDSKPFVGQPTESVTTKDVTYYVGPAGSDGFDCLQPNRPCKGIQGAVDKSPKGLNNHVTVQLLDTNDGGIVSYTGAIVQGFRSGSTTIPDAGLPLFEIRGRMGPFVPATGLTSGTLTAFAAQSGATMPLLTDALGGWADGGLIGQYLTATSGTGSTGTETAPVTWPIIANTATTISLAATSITLASGTGYQLQKTTTRINAPAAPFAVLTTTTARATYPGTAGLIFVNNMGAFFAVNRVGFTVGTAMARGITVGSTRVSNMLVQMNMGTGAVAGVTFNGLESVPSVNVDRMASIATAGVHVSFGSTGSTTAMGGISFTNSYLRGGTQGLALGAVPSAVIQGVTFDTITTGVSVAGVCFGIQFLQSRVASCTTGWSSIIGSIGFPVTTAQVGAVDFSNNTTAITMEGGGSTIFLNGTSGTGNTTGLNISLGAKARVSSSTTITGTTEVSIDGTSSDFATMRAATPKLVTNTYGTIFFQ